MLPCLTQNYEWKLNSILPRVKLYSPLMHELSELQQNNWATTEDSGTRICTMVIQCINPWTRVEDMTPKVYFDKQWRPRCNAAICRWVGLQTLWWFRLKDLSIDEMVGAWCFGCLSGPPGFTCWISFAPVFSLIYCWVLILALSPCYILIYMF